MAEIYREPMARLELRKLDPEDAALSVTEAGYRSHFITVSEVLDLGGSVALARAWLDETAESTAWAERQEKSRQLSFFRPRPQERHANKPSATQHSLDIKGNKY